MSKLISLSIDFSSEVSPIAALESLFRSDFTNFLSPKIGKVVIDKASLEFGIPSERYQEALLDGEQVIVPSVTSLIGYADATLEINDFLSRSRQAKKCSAEFFGDALLEYVRNTNHSRANISRYGSDNSYLPIVRCYVFQLHSVSVGLTLPCPMFFLKYWWPEDRHPRYATPETAEHNWDSLIDAVQSVVSTAGVNDIRKVSLHLEGSTVNNEQEWLIAKAQRLPNLEVDFA